MKAAMWRKPKPATRKRSRAAQASSAARKARKQKSGTVTERVSYFRQQGKEQVRKRGLPPLCESNSGGKPLFLTCSIVSFVTSPAGLVRFTERGQALFPDLFYC